MPYGRILCLHNAELVSVKNQKKDYKNEYLHRKSHKNF